MAQVDWLGPNVGGHLAPFLYSSREVRELSELSQWLCHDDSTITIILVIIFTARCTIVQSAALRLHVARLSVCDVGGSGSHRLEILENNCTDN